jgi:alpha-L-fucosidase
MGDESWFDGAGFGVFLHWDHAAQQELETSWPLVGGVPVLPGSLLTPVTAEQYHSTAATFDPVRWDPEDVARRCAEAGAAYVVLTTKHHSGWCLWPSAHSAGFDVSSSPWGEDILGPWVEAVRRHGMKVGFYFSLPDWHHPDYPPFTDEMRPYGFGGPPIVDEAAWDRFTVAMFGQLEELLTRYGTIDLLWFDGGWERSERRWRSGELEAHIRSLAPDVIINDRLPGVPGYATPEQFVPPSPPRRPWETCMTMNDSWGWVPKDTRWKSATRLVHTLCEVVGKGGNLLLNLSPMGDGALPEPQLERLAVITAWMAKHGEAVHGTEPGLEPWQHYGPSTRKGDTTYAFCLARPYEEVTIRGVPVRRVRRVTALGTGAELAFDTRTGIVEGFAADPDGELTITVPAEAVDDVATVLAIEIDPPVAPA